jgi:hypothetical protein
VLAAAVVEGIGLRRMGAPKGLGIEGARALGS